MKHNNKQKKRFYKPFILIAYILCMVVLIVEASMNSQTSSIQSNLVGDIIADIVNNVTKDQTTIIYPESVEIENKQAVYNHFVGDELTLDVKTLPENATYKQKTFHSSDESIAKVSDKGEVLLLKQGSVTITVKNAYNPSLSDFISINCFNIEATAIETKIENAVEEEGIYTLYLENESDYKITNIITPSNTTIQNVEYTIIGDYLKVNESGYLYDLKDSKGDLVTINARCGEVYSEIKAVVTFKSKVDLTAIEFEISKTQIYVGESIKFSISCTPTNATFKNYSILESQTGIIKLKNNAIEGVTPGIVSLKVQSAEYTNIYDEVQIEVLAKEKLESFTASISSSIVVGKTKKISISNIKPNKYADTSSITYRSLNEEIATVNKKGEVKAIKVGTTTIVVEAENGFTQNVLIEVVEYEGYEKDSNIIGFVLNTTESKDVVVGNTKKIKLNDLYYVEEWIFDDSGNKNGSKNIEFVLQENSKNKISNKTELVVNQLGLTSFYVHHLASNTYSKEITINIIDSFAIKNENNENIEKIDLIVGNKSNIIIENSVDKTFDIQNYKVSLYDQTGKEIVSDPIIKEVEKGIYEISSIYAEGQYTLKVTPIFNGDILEIYQQEITININHKYIDEVDVRLFDNNGEDLLIINNQLSLIVNDVVNFDLMIDEAVSKYDFEIISENEAVIIVNHNQLIAKGPGQSKVIFKETNTLLTYEYEFFVKNIIALNEDKPFTISGENVFYDKKSEYYNMTNGYSAHLTLNLDSSSTYSKVEYSSSNEKVATVGNDGIITPHKPGRVEITMTCSDGTGTYVTKTIKINVNKQQLIEDLGSFFYKVRKALGHFGAFLVLGIFSTLTYLTLVNKRKWFVSIPLNFIAGFYIAFLTEFIQRYVPGRSGNVNDIKIDMSGFLISSIILTIILLIVELCKNKKSST